MNVIPMMHEIKLAANSMIGESSLPDFLIAADDRPEFMRVRTFNQLDCALDSHVARRSQQQVNVFGHDHKRVQFVAAFATMPIESFQEEACVKFDDEQFPAMISRERHEIGPRRGDESYRLQGETSAAESRTSLQTLNWHEWNSCPSRLFFL